MFLRSILFQKSVFSKVSVFGEMVVFRSVPVFEKFPWTVSGLRKWGLGLFQGDFSIRILAISWLDSEEPG